jgi:glycosyltransferase involved in cell wall biosynthesis
VRALNELGYVVDIINFDNTTWLPKRRYDLFVGHGGLNFTRISDRLAPDTVRIYFSTGMYWRDANERLATRLQWLTLRRGVLLPPYRAADRSEENANRSAHGIICIGNDAVVKSYSSFTSVAALNNAVYPITGTGVAGKDFAAGRKHFLVFAGRGNVLKGLDLLLEAFSGTDLHLHVCQAIEPEFHAAYRRECNLEPNIHLYGQVGMRSAAFRALVTRCNWVITATCTEGQPGAILECMGHGLVPIMPDAVNIDRADWAIRLDRCDVESIREVATKAARMSAEACEGMALRASDVVRTTYTPEAFRFNFRKAVQDVVRNTERSHGKDGQ